MCKIFLLKYLIYIVQFICSFYIKNSDLRECTKAVYFTCIQHSNYVNS